MPVIVLACWLLSATIAVGSADVPATATIVAEPAVLDLGMIPLNDAVTGRVILTNHGDESQILLGCRATCGCTTANCETGRVLAPGEQMEILVTLRAGMRSERLSKRVTFLFADHPPISATVEGTATTVIRIEPPALDPQHNPSGRIVLRAVDGVPFRVLRTVPADAAVLPEDPQTTHELHLNPQRLLDRAPRTRLVVLHLDHPRVDHINVPIALRITDDDLPLGPPGHRDPHLQLARTLQQTRFDVLLRADDQKAIIALIDAFEIDIDAVDDEGQTPLMRAARWGRVQVAEHLLDLGVCIDSVCQRGRTALFYACADRRTEDPAMVRLLLQHGASPNVRDSRGVSIIAMAAGFGTPEILGAMIEAGADVRGDGLSRDLRPIFFAARFGSQANFDVLVRAGADPDQRDAQGRTARSILAERE